MVELEKKCENKAQIHEKWIPEFNKKRCLKIDPDKSKNTKQMDPKWLAKKGVAPLGAPSASKVLPRIEK